MPGIKIFVNSVFLIDRKTALVYGCDSWFTQEAKQMAVKLSKTSKLNAKSWSLQAGNTCPGSIDPVSRETLPVCSGCYAKSGNYRFGNVKAPREHNREDWKRPDWVSDMVSALKTERYFRWLDSGDIYHPALAFKIFLVIEKTPWVSHWLPTKSYNIPKIRAVLDRIAQLPNVALRYSSPSITGEYIAGFHGSTVIPYDNSETSADIVCGAYTRGGKCGDCFACYDKTVSTVAYVAHGRTMASKLKKLAA